MYLSPRKKSPSCLLFSTTGPSGHLCAMHQSTLSGSVYANRAEKGQGEEHKGAKGKLRLCSSQVRVLPLVQGYLCSYCLSLWLLHSQLCNKPASTVVRNVSLVRMFDKVEVNSGIVESHPQQLVMSWGYFAFYAYTLKLKSTILSVVGFFFFWHWLPLCP